MIQFARAVGLEVSLASYSMLEDLLLKARRGSGDHFGTARYPAGRSRFPSAAGSTMGDSVDSRSVSLVIIQKSDVPLKCFLGSWEFDFFKEFGDLFILWGNSLGCYCSSREVYLLYPKRQLGMLSLRPAFRRHWKTARRFLINCSGVLAAMPISSTYCAH